MSKRQVVTISFARYSGWRRRWRAFAQMGRAPEQLKNIPGMQFAKMLGVGGGNGFSLWPNWGVYGLLGVWDNEKAAREFFAAHPVFSAIRDKAEEVWTVFMRTLIAHGAWDKVSPFIPNVAKDEKAPIGVLTRATIRTSRLLHFWRFVPSVSRSVEKREGLLFSAGVGELPIVQQATFSLWQNARFMKAYAYESSLHREVIRRTRELNWYKEELFARFQPYKTEGSWHAKNPLEPYLCRKIQEDN